MCFCSSCLSNPPPGDTLFYLNRPDRLSEVSPSLLDLVLRFIPDSAFTMREVSPTLRRHTHAYFDLYLRKITSNSSHAYPLLSILIRSRFDLLAGRPGAQLHDVAFQCLKSIPKSIRALGVPVQTCPDKLLTVQEVGKCESWLEDSNLEPVWTYIFHRHIRGAHPGTADLPGEFTLASAIRPWLSVNENQTLVQEITWGNCKELHLTCFPKEMGMCTALQTLNLADNQLFTLPEGVFQRLPALQTLDLHRNQLVYLPEKVFQRLPALQTLDLHRNQLVYLPEKVFQGMPALQTLNLSSNKIISLLPGVFQGLPALQWLSLFDNWLSSLPVGVFDGLTALQYLCLEKNQLTSLPAGIFRELAALRVLYLNNNPIPSLPEEVLEELTSLVKIHCSRFD